MAELCLTHWCQVAAVTLSLSPKVWAGEGWWGGKGGGLR